MSTLNVDKVDPSTGTALEIGSSGDTITIPSGATIVNSGTATGFGGGKLVKYGTATYASQTEITSTSYVTTGLECTFVPTSGSNIIWVQAMVPCRMKGDTVSSSERTSAMALYEDASKLTETEAGTIMTAATTAEFEKPFIPVTLFWTGSAASTSSRIYKFMAKKKDNSVVDANKSGFASWMLVMELEV